MAALSLRLFAAVVDMAYAMMLTSYAMPLFSPLYTRQTRAAAATLMPLYAMRHYVFSLLFITPILRHEG